ncbi:MAG: esterase family protein, partial [Verrucomicrobiaceae bacterium]
MKFVPPLAICAVMLPLVTAVCAAPAKNKDKEKDKEFPEQSESTIGPDYQEAPETKQQNGVPRGEVREFTMDSKDSKIYKGIAKGEKGEVPYKRKVAVYMPAKFRNSQVMPFIVVQDGIGYKDIMSRTLDNLIDEKRVPEQVAIFINSGGGDSKGSQRGLEYDTVDDTYCKFIEKEVLPEVTRRYKIKFTTDPEGRATMGASSGAAAAFTMAWFHPELYRRVLSYSGTYVNQQWPENNRTPHGAWEYHENLIKRAVKKPIRVWLHVSDKDNGWDRDDTSYHNWVRANKLMAAELKDKGYPYQFVLSTNSGHVDWKVVSQTLPSALEWVW